MNVRRRRTPPILRKTQPADPALSQSQMADGMQIMQKKVGQEVQRDRKEPGRTPRPTTAIVISAGPQCSPVYLSEAGSCYAQIVAGDNRLISESRNRSIAAQFGDITAEKQGEYSGLPVELIKITNRFLDANDLALCRHDPEFWESFGYLIGSAESISIEAVIEAISMCVLNADGPTRRTHFYAELQVAKKMKSIRDRELRNKTDRVAIRRKLALTVSEGDRKRASLGLPPAAVCDSQRFVEETQAIRKERESIYLRAMKRAEAKCEPGFTVLMPDWEDYTNEEKLRLAEISKELGELPQD